MATLRRRSARLSKNTQQSASAYKSHLNRARLGSLIERDETPEFSVQPQSLNNVVNTPTTVRTLQSHLDQLSALTTPKTEPRLDPGEMHPELIHQSTAKAPDSGLKLGFVDVAAKPPRSLASIQNTPSKSRESLPVHLTSPNFEFRFGTDSQLSIEAQRLMKNVREEAAKIKAQMQAEKALQDQKDGQAEHMFDSVNAAGRKIAKPKGRAGRFSEVHMAQFKKMDSIANHPSAYRSQPGYAQPTNQSLKRSGSRAGLDESERPRVPEKTTNTRLPAPVLGRPYSVSPFKSIDTPVESSQSAKRVRREDPSSVHGARTKDIPQVADYPTIPRPVSSSLMSPTKASLARSTTNELFATSPQKPSMLPRSNSVKSLKTIASVPHNGQSKPLPATTVIQQKSNLNRPLPSLPQEEVEIKHGTPALQRSKSNLALSPSKTPTTISKLPMLSGLRSILRSGLKSNSAASAATAAASSPVRNDTPKRPNAAHATIESNKKVDFTPSVKSRYAVKLAAASPSPAKLSRPISARPPVVPYDSSAWILECDDDNWEDAEDSVEYPVLPQLSSASDIQSFADMAKAHTRRESSEFKSIFTTLHHPSRPSTAASLTSVGTAVNRPDPVISAIDASKSGTSKISASTIRRVRKSGEITPITPFEETDVGTVPHGLAGKKRRHESIVENDKFGTDDDAKENRHVSVGPRLPGGWNDSSTVLDEDDGEDMHEVQRSSKRVRVEKSDDVYPKVPPSDAAIKKPNQARELAAKSAKDRKSRGILSMSRLNMLSRPKQRG